MSAVATYSYAHSVTYVADNMLKSLKDIIRMSGLDPAHLVGEWTLLNRGISAWLESRHLEIVRLEIVDPRTDGLVTRWDISVEYAGWDPSGDGTFWTDTDQLRYAIAKQGVVPSQATYRVVVTTKPGSPDVDGWTTVSLRSTDGMVRQSLGTTVQHSGLSANTAYWRQA